MNVLSLFDGMSCGQIALDQLGIKVDNYYAAEIDKYAIEIAKKNYPKTIQIGDVTKIKGSDLPKIDLLIGGSPCQGFSFAGKQLNFNDPRSALFFEFVRLLKETNPKYFMLENVRMKKEYQDVISHYLNVEPIMINSALVSAQNRVRLYWTNISNITQPENKGIVLKDILEDLPNNYVKMSNTFTERQKGNRCLTDMTKEKASNLSAMEYVKNGRQGDYLACDIKGSPIQIGIADDINGHDILKRVYSEEGKSPTLNTMGGGNREPKVACGAFRGRYYDENGKRTDHKESVAGKTNQMLEIRTDGKTNTITTVQKDNVLTKDNLYYRKLTPLECERLQTVPDNYTEGVSNTQRYKMLGNGWTVEVIKHIFKGIEQDAK
jgi:DNA (cytosine-5)-methyltransferase 3A